MLTWVDLQWHDIHSEFEENHSSVYTSVYNVLVYGETVNKMSHGNFNVSMKKLVLMSSRKETHRVAKIFKFLVSTNQQPV